MGRVAVAEGGRWLGDAIVGRCVTAVTSEHHWQQRCGSVPADAAPMEQLRLNPRPSLVLRILALPPDLVLYMCRGRRRVGKCRPWTGDELPTIPSAGKEPLLAVTRCTRGMIWERE